MATQLTKQLIDDLDGTAAVGTVSFSWGGQAYELDLSRKNTAAMEKAIKPYVEHARRARPARRRAAGGRRTTATSSSRASNAARLGEMREWGRANGWEVSDRGRVPAALVEAFEAAQ